MAGDKASRVRANWNRWIAALWVVALAPVVISFNARLATIRQIREDEARLGEQVSVEQVRHDDLLALRSYVASDAYVEHWARVQARMTKPGEVAVIPLAPTSLPAETAPPPAAGAPATIMDEWWAVFFDANTQPSASPRQ
jgi:hypothetical protein